ncbi:MAG: phage tail protein [Nostoc sp. DedQUE04]|uniref:phage tail protein n=1 Tax=Nostoc sp. DedQUE04 TaxID=3075390 RepID=UPI002AD57C90|nr:phage tail protein [Nostoc sp. DedQUE04]MDZ8140708.1 phage tail protein [Nostoc sp. DedQUE04]
MPSISGTRLDFYKNFKFKVRMEGQVVAAVSKVSGLKRTTEVIEHRTGGDPSTVYKSPGQTKYDAITLERGITKDTKFEEWAKKVWALGGSPEVSLADFRKDIIIEVYDEGNQNKVTSYNVFGCWVSEYQALPDLDASANAVAIEYIKLENEGWERA